MMGVSLGKPRLFQLSTDVPPPFQSHTPRLLTSRLVVCFQRVCCSPAVNMLLSNIDFQNEEKEAI